MKNTKMPEVDEELFVCLQCGYCTPVCPTYNQLKWESISPRGKIFFLKKLKEKGLLKKLFKRNPKIDEDFIKSMYLCTTCGMCKEVCHENIDTVELWEDIRKWLVDNQYGPMDKQKYGYAFIKTSRNPFNEDPHKRDEIIPKDIKLPEKADVIFYPGCTASFRRNELVEASVRLLHKAGIKFTTLGSDEWCCGSFLLRTGQGDIVKDYAKHNINSFKKRGAKIVVSSCSGCYRTMSIDYPKILGKEGLKGIKVYHLSQYLLKLIKEGKLVLKNKINKKVTYHDPCHLGRHISCYDEPRQIIKMIPGVEFVEMPNTRERATCCGAGGGFKAAFPDHAVNIASKRVQEAMDVGADMIVSCCPFCKLNLIDGAKAANINIEIIDIVELLRRAVE